MVQENQYIRSCFISLTLEPHREFLRGQTILHMSVLMKALLLAERYYSKVLLLG